MFEFFLAAKYLIPKKRSISTSLIALMSIGVMSLVVWLIIIFLSVTIGIEKNWISKLVTLNAPIRITPTDEYYSSYYYRIDNISSSSDYNFKNIAEKASSIKSNPYNLEIDMEIPEYWPRPIKKNDKTLLDPVKELYGILEKENMPGFSFQDYELSSALLKLTLIRNAKDNLGESRTSCLSQMSYLLSFPSNNPKLSDLICPYRSCDLNHLIESSITDHSFSLFPTTGINDFTAKYNDYSVPIKFLPENQTFDCIYEQSDEFFSRVVIDGNSNSQKKENSGQFIIENKIPYFISEKLGKKRLSNLKKVFAPNILFSATMENQILKKDTVISDAILSLKGTIQNKDILAKANLQDIQVISSNSPILPPTSYSQENNYFVFLPKSFQKSGVLIGDKGHLSYAGRTSTSTQEQRISIYVGGFYDPGFLPTASRFLLVPFAITKLINSSTSTISPDNSPTNGINIWFDDYHQADVIKAKLEKALTKSDIAPFWKVTTYKEYEFSKDLLEQFQSDRTLFTLIGVIILIVACSNIISLLILLVNDKKKEIAVIQAMGGSKKSIVLIFGLCGVIMGFFSCLIGSLAAIFTLQHLDVIVTILSTIQGHAAFNPAFFGQNLPNHLSSEAMLFIFITTPILSLIAGIIPAIKASKLQPSQILRSQ